MKRSQDPAKSLPTVTLNGIEYYQHCTDPNHNCYLRPMPQVVNVPINTILKNLAGGIGLVSKQPIAKSSDANKPIRQPKENT